MNRVPKRVSLISETASVLRDGINRGVWIESLPGERYLADQLQVSRPTLRAALLLLQKDGMVRTAHGRRRLIFPVENPTGSPQRQVVGLINRSPVAQIPQSVFQLIMDLRHYLHRVGLESELYIAPYQSPAVNKRKLEDFIKEKSISCCVLMHAPEEEQEWFYDRGIPTLILGSTYPSTELPSLDVDYYSVCRHAAGVFLRRGHRRLVFVRPDDRIAGDHASVEGFMDGIAQSPHTDAHGTVLRHRNLPADLERQLGLLLSSEEPGPTGIFTSNALETLITIMYLQRRGILIPKDISIIARDRDLFFDYLQPTITHYAYNTSIVCRRLTRLIRQLVERGSVSTRKSLIYPELIDGRSLDHPSD